jgi:Domain of unknown function (DUF4260)
MTHEKPMAYAVSGGVRALLRLEGAALLAASVALYAQLSGDWEQFAVLFLVPDASLAAYLFGPRAGAAAYNALHATPAALALAAAALLLHAPLALAAALVWLAHIGLDRALGFGLKYASGFRDTHLGHL